MKLNKYIDHTNLKPTATRPDIEKLCREAREYDFASVCVNPCDVALCAGLLDGSGVRVCTVIGFPLGRNTTDIKVAEAKQALLDGCDEFDMVMNVGKLKDGDYDYVGHDIKAVVGAVAGHTVKVILETGFLTDKEIAQATRLACASGANFVKTCTGFTGGVATTEVVRIMKENVTGGVKVKASAGIRTREAALSMINAGAERIGTSNGVYIVSE